MTGETMPSRNAGRAGFLGSLLAFANALAGFIESRLALFARESKTALWQLLGLIACMVGALLFLAMGYAFLIVGAVAGIARLLDVQWLWVALVAALVHFALVLIFLLGARVIVTKTPFPQLRVELQKDREWLKNLDETSRPTT
ncbi:MAG: phage holin family protein [Chthoniobacterales bacterium]